MKVTLIGAGPGNPGLLTLRGAECLAQAEVVLYDRFVGPDILSMIPATAEQIDVGKYAGNHPVPQSEINRLLLQKAQAGFNVVRLKGGDPFVFGRGGEELELLVQQQIPFEVVPGVTSAIAGAAFAGIPVTHRDYASTLHIITSHGKNDSQPDINYPALVALGGTLVFLMGVATLPDITAGCLAAGMDAQMPAAIVENATYSYQRKFIGTIQTLPALAEQNAVVSPALIIVGRVAELAEQYDWFSQLPLKGQRIIVPRIKPEPSKLAAALRQMAAEVDELYYAHLTTIPSNLKLAMAELDTYSWLVLTSGFAVKTLFSFLVEQHYDLRRLHQLQIACVGPESMRELGRFGLQADFMPDEYNGQALAQGLLGLLKPDDRLLLARVQDGSSELPTVLSRAGVAFTDRAIYQRSLNSLSITGDDYDYAAFASSSAVEGFLEATVGRDLSTLNAVCIGRLTAATARQAGLKVYQSKQATIDSLVQRIVQLVGEKNGVQ
ncbi:MAG: uroporphyrinogen-III C-methyltransferase [Coriobacteriales bacterium]|jgi:uroporphyrinogen III methyltransferase/synthase|nr:uroporphyrinogen-III C-methyltransferase [Coriobacteriales bacterium]